MGGNPQENPSFKHYNAYITEPPLGLNPNLIESDKDSPEYEEYDEARCEVSGFCFSCFLSL